MYEWRLTLCTTTLILSDFVKFNNLFECYDCMILNEVRRYAYYGKAL